MFALKIWIIVTILNLICRVSCSSLSLKNCLSNLIDHKSLSSSEAEDAWDLILTSYTESNPAAVGALLSLLRMKGENPAEIAGMVRAMKKVCITAKCTGDLLDIVGTGGDGADTINISTASSILAAASGCKVSKAGNRSVSSRCGSADVLEMLGIRLDLNKDQIEKVFDRCGICFLYAPVFHPAVKAVAPIRKQLGVRTIFNILGPLTNAANANRVVLGVFEEQLLDLLADSLILLGSVDHAVVIHGCGLDEISPLGPSQIVEIKNIASPHETKKRYSRKRYQFDPKSVGVPRCSLKDLQGGDPEMNAIALKETLAKGEFTNAKRDAVVLNAGMGLYVYGKAKSISEGVKLARKSLEAGLAEIKLDEWKRASQSV